MAFNPELHCEKKKCKCLFDKALLRAIIVPFVRQRSGVQAMRGVSGQAP